MADAQCAPLRVGVWRCRCGSPCVGGWAFVFTGGASPSPTEVDGRRCRCGTPCVGWWAFVFTGGASPSPTEVDGRRCRCGTPFVWCRHQNHTNQSHPKNVGSEAVRRFCTLKSRLFHRPRHGRKPPFPGSFLLVLFFFKRKGRKPHPSHPARPTRPTRPRRSPRAFAGGG